MTMRRELRDVLRGFLAVTASGETVLLNLVNDDQGAVGAIHPGFGLFELDPGELETSNAEVENRPLRACALCFGLGDRAQCLAVARQPGEERGGPVGAG